MRVIVTGASGFLGRNVLLRAPRDWEIVATYWQRPDLATFVTAHKLAHVHPVRCNLLDPASVDTLLDEAGDADAVLYLAANGDPGASAAQPRWDLDSNAAALVTLLERASIGHLVFVSSGAVYDGLRGEVTPATPVSPRLPYAISKLAAEQYVRFFAERRRTVGSYVNVRFFGAYGPHEPPRKITTRWLAAVGAGREFVVRGDGRNLVDFMYVDDAADGFLALLEARGERLTVDFASGSPRTVAELVADMARAIGRGPAVRHEGETAEYIEFRSADRTLRDRFGIAPATPFDEGFRRLARFLAGAGQEARA